MQNCQTVLVMSLIIVARLLTAGSCPLASQQAALKPASIIVQHELDVKFLKSDSHLVIGRNRELVVGDPISAYLHLFLVSENQGLQVHSLSELRGKVTIRTKEDALAFVRLASSATTYRFFGGPFRLEILPREQFNVNVTYGDGEAYELLRKLPNGYYGIASTAELVALGLKSATVRKSANGFVIERPVVVFSSGPDGKSQVIDVTEWVGHDGTYREMGASTENIRNMNGIRWLVLADR